MSDILRTCNTCCRTLHQLQSACCRGCCRTVLQHTATPFCKTPRCWQAACCRSCCRHTQCTTRCNTLQHTATNSNELDLLNIKNASIHTHTYFRSHTHSHIQIHTHTHTHTHIQIHTHTHIQIHTHMQIFTGCCRHALCICAELLHSALPRITLYHTATH